jgi:hypothetical protein
MFFLWVYPDTITDPNFLCMTEKYRRCGHQSGILASQFLRSPFVVRIQESDPISATGVNTTIPSRADSAMWFLKEDDIGILAPESGDGVIS